MSRRAHKKSRTGCVECKRRHIKCDENRPTCTYLDNNPSPTFTLGVSHSMTFLEISGITGSFFEDFTFPQPEDQVSVNMHHLELLHHVLTGIDKDFGFGLIRALEDLWKMAVGLGMSVPYLMHEILAMSALHLSICRPRQQEFYRHQAIQPQTQGISLFNNRFIVYLHLHRGFRAVASRSWHILRETELKPILEPAEKMPGINESTGHECDGLLALFDSTNPSPLSVDACRQAIEYLQCVFDAYKLPSEGQGSTDFIFAWPVVVPADYVDLLSQRHSEALIVLAYYAVLLHYSRDLWVIGDGGRYLIQSITSCLGQQWEKWLAWPNSILDDV
ncbi:hypothetical protein V1506DRAFT_567735 [Lipomyces tetrasporus]